MAKLLPKKVAKQVKDAEAWSGGGGYLLEPGQYAARLAKVEQKESRSSEYDYLSWEFSDLHDEDGNKKAGRQWHNTSFSPKALGNLKATLNAFGYDEDLDDVDSDELIGEWVVLDLGTEVQAQGKRAGEKRNVIRGLTEFDPDEWDFDPESLPPVGERVQRGADDNF